MIPQDPFAFRLTSPYLEARGVSPISPIETPDFRFVVERFIFGPDGRPRVRGEARWARLQWLQLLLCMRWASTLDWIEAGHCPDVRVVTAIVGEAERRELSC